MRKYLISLALSALIASPALADVKSGVEAWGRGDYKSAIKEWRPLAINGDADAQFNLGQAYKLGRGVEVDLAQASDWYRKAAMQGHLQAEDNFGLVQFQLGARDKAMPFIEKSAARGEPRAQYILGTALFNGDMVTKDWVKAYALMTRSAASGLSPATASLAQMDKYIPMDQRQKGLSMARDMEVAALRPAIQGPPSGAAAPRPAPSTQIARSVDVPGPDALPDVYVPPSRPATRPVVATPRPAPVVAAPRPVVRTVATPVTTPVAVNGKGWRVQLGAFGNEARARALFNQLEGSISALSGLQPYLVKAGAVTRLQAGPLASSAAAERLCAAVKAKGTGCLPVAP
jgi:uncharacterized protein